MGDTLVLCYHAVSDRWPAPLSVTRAALEDQLRRLLRRGYVPATFSQAVADPPAERTVAVTFDDGFRSVLELGLPILDGLGVVATMFLPTDFVGRGGPLTWPGIDGWLGGPFAGELEPMSWDDARGLRALGWEIGSHTCTHPRLTGLDDGSLRAELVRSRERCERELGTPCRSIAYPYGDVDARVVRAAEAAGYVAGAALPVDFAATGRLDHPRVGIYHADGRSSFALKTSAGIRRLRRSRAWPVLAGLRYRAKRLRTSA